MNSVYTLSNLSSLSRFPLPLPPHRRNQCFHPLSCSFVSPRRRRRRRRTYRRKKTDLNSTTTPSPDLKLQTFIDLDFSAQSSLLNTLHYSSQSRIQKFISSATDAYDDLQTLFTVDENRRVVVCCRRSTVGFVGSLVVWSVVFIFVIRVLGNLGQGLLRGRSGSRNEPVVVRRDRSLGGKEVVVGRIANVGKNLRVSPNPLSMSSGTISEVSQRVWKNPARTREKKLPKWWPASPSLPGSVLNKEEYQREADRLLRVILDNRTSGKDIMDDDIIQLRQLCRTFGVRVSIDTKNTRDSIYRASVDFVLNVCTWFTPVGVTWLGNVRAPSNFTNVQIDGEDARQFVAGFAENIGLENIDAARIVSAAVAARTRSWFLQAWALEMQGKHAEAKLEVSKICRVLQIFPPEKFSPEMEMVGRGLEKHLKVEQREFLLNTFLGICGEENRRIGAEALNLMTSPGVDD